MLREVIILDTAITDISAGKVFYDEIEYGLGAYFSDCTFTEIKALRFRFGLHKEEYGYHRILLKKFPFAAYYEHINGVSRIVAVLDMRRNPKTRELLLKLRAS